MEYPLQVYTPHDVIWSYKNCDVVIYMSFILPSYQSPSTTAVRTNTAGIMADNITYTSVDKDVSDILNAYFVTSFRNGYIKANDVVLPVYFKKFGQRMQEMEVRDDDIWVCSYPKTGFDF